MQNQICATCGKAFNAEYPWDVCPDCAELPIEQATAKPLKQWINQLVSVIEAMDDANKELHQEVARLKSYKTLYEELVEDHTALIEKHEALQRSGC